MLICPTCRMHFEGEEHFCPRDGSPLASAPSAAADALVGRVLGGRYRLVEKLGQGGMGTVYQAVHTLMDKRVAVKILRAELATDAEAVARFHREARSASRLDHDHCIRVTDFGQTEDSLLYLVMELLDGESLGQVARRGPVVPPRVAAIGVAIAEALQHAHEAGIVHRDLKPDNVFLARRPRGRELVKVLDFGLAKLANDGALGPSLTRDGTVFGTPEYMAPEQAEGAKLDGRTDVYALGIILYQLLVGEVPFRAPNFMALLTMQVSEEPVPPRARRPELELDEGLEGVVMRCLEKNPDDRYQTAQELADALEPFAAGDESQLMLLPTRPEGTGGRRAMPRSGENPTVAEPNEARAGDGPESQLRGEVLREPRPFRRGLALGLGGLVVLAGSVVIAVAVRKPAPAPPTHQVDPAPVETPFTTAEKMIQAHDLEGAEKVLRAERARKDSVDVQYGLSALAEARGIPLGALGHLEHAAKLAPGDPEPRARLGALLLRLGNYDGACRNAREALKLDPEGARTPAAKNVIAQARCKETP